MVIGKCIHQKEPLIIIKNKTLLFQLLQKSILVEKYLLEFPAGQQ